MKARSKRGKKGNKKDPRKVEKRRKKGGREATEEGRGNWRERETERNRKEE